LGPPAHAFRYIKRQDPSVPTVHGYIWRFSEYSRPTIHPSGGAGILISRPAAAVLRENVYKSCAFNRFNDITIGECARKNNVRMVHSINFWPFVDRLESGKMANVGEILGLFTAHYSNPDHFRTFSHFLKERNQKVCGP
jgi:hypothetical protein